MLHLPLGHLRTEVRDGKQDCHNEGGGCWGGAPAGQSLGGAVGGAVGGGGEGGQLPVRSQGGRQQRGRGGRGLRGGGRGTVVQLRPHHPLARLLDQRLLAEQRLRLGFAEDDADLWQQAVGVRLLRLEPTAADVRVRPGDRGPDQQTRLVSVDGRAVEIGSEEGGGGRGAAAHMWAMTSSIAAAWSLGPFSVCSPFLGDFDSPPPPPPPTRACLTHLAPCTRARRPVGQG